MKKSIRILLKNIQDDLKKVENELNDCVLFQDATQKKIKQAEVEKIFNEKVEKYKKIGDKQPRMIPLNRKESMFIYFNEDWKYHIVKVNNSREIC